MTEKAKISDAELCLMQLLWGHGGLTSQQMILLLQPKKNWAPTTTKTLLQRLVKKGFINKQNDQKPTVYSANVSEQATMVSMTENLLLHICQRKMGKTLAQLIELTPLTHEDIALLLNAIEKKKSSAVDNLPCDCLFGLCQCPEHQ